MIDCKAFVGDGPTYACLLCGRPGPEHAEFRTSKPLTWDTFWQRVRETGWNPTPAELHAALIEREQPASNQRFTVHDSPYALVGEIERLTAELAYAKANANTATNTVLAENVVLKAERDRLTANLEAGAATHKRMTAERDRLTDDVAALKHDVERYITISSQEATESSRLRAALERIASGHTVAFPAHIAREALTGEDRPKDRPEVNAALPIGADVNHSKRTESAETAPNADKVSVSRLSDEASDGCQHDLLRPDTTIEVIDAWKARCKVCINFFDLPGRPENG